MLLQAPGREGVAENKTLKRVRCEPGHRHLCVFT